MKKRAVMRMSETEELAEEVAEETVRLISSKFGDLEKRIEVLELYVKQQLHKSRLDTIEINRTISEKSEYIKEELERINMNLLSEIQKLKEDMTLLQENLGSKSL